MNAEDYDITALYLRSWLSGLRRITGNQYPQLLKQCGLEQYSQKYPPATNEVIAKRRQLLQLFTAVREYIGIDGLNLFMRNFGRELAHISAALPQAKQLSAHINSSVSPPEFLSWLRLLIKKMNILSGRLLLLNKVRLLTNCKFIT